MCTGCTGCGGVVVVDDLDEEICVDDVDGRIEDDIDDDDDDDNNVYGLAVTPALELQVDGCLSRIWDLNDDLLSRNPPSPQEQPLKWYT